MAGGGEGAGAGAGEPAGGGPAGARCFVAVWPPADLVDRLRRMDRPDRPGLRWTAEDQWHITLKFFAAVDPDALVAALDSAWAGPPGFPPTRAVAGPVPEALSRRVWMVPVGGLEPLAAAVDRATAGLAPPAGRFRGHLTLARARRPPALRGLPRPELTAEWAVAELVAVRSELGPRRARHIILRSWPLPR